MRINVLQHTPNEGPGAIKAWAEDRGNKVYVYHPETFGIFPKLMKLTCWSFWAGR